MIDRTLKITSKDEMFTMTDYECVDQDGRPVKVRVCDDVIIIFDETMEGDD